MAPTPASVDDYVRALPDEVQVILEEIRRRVRSAAPDGEEVITYQIPTLKVAGQKVVHFAAWKNHIAMYPVPTGDNELAGELEPYRVSEGTLRFPLKAPIPYNLIERVAAALVKEHAQARKRADQA